MREPFRVPGGAHKGPGAMPVDNADMDDLSGKVALVTGASRGIGAAAAIALAKAGADVAVNYRSRSKEADAVCSTIREFGRRALAVQADVSQNVHIREMVSRVQKELGTVSILVNNAAVGRQRNIDEITEQDWDEAINTNLKSTFLLTQAVLPAMRAQRWGRIINMSSIAAQTGGVVGPHYAASKAGMLGLTHSLASLLAKEGVTVNEIAPALIETEMVTANPRANPGLIPVGRFGTVEEVASVVVLLAGNGYITGQTINVNGGWYMS
ncbi:MAG TPA: 3-oxoacyl-ACP reductase family protein [Terriglobales bacterium]|nr:3-oxoacyl-ACP reductase family protein [Terriglobales bacterium]